MRDIWYTSFGYVLIASSNTILFPISVRWLVATCYHTVWETHLDDHESAVRILNPLPHSTNLNKATNLLVDDIVRSKSEGIIGIDPYGRRDCIFLQVVACLADYLAISSVSELIDHVALSFFMFNLFNKTWVRNYKQLRNFESYSHRIGFSWYEERIFP